MIAWPPSAGLDAFNLANMAKVSGKAGGVAGVLVGTHCYRVHVYVCVYDAESMWK